MSLRHRIDVRVYLHPAKAQHIGCTVLITLYYWGKKPALLGKAKVSSNKQDQEEESKRKLNP